MISRGKDVKAAVDTISKVDQKLLPQRGEPERRRAAYFKLKGLKSTRVFQTLT